MSIKRIIVICCNATVLLLATSVAFAVNPSYERGVEANEDYRYSEALMHFMFAAEQGDPNAQRNLGLMLLYGERLYSRNVPRNHEQAKRWLLAASRQGCEVSSFMLKVMAQHAQ